MPGAMRIRANGGVVVKQGSASQCCCQPDDTTYLQAYLCSDGSPTGEWKDSTTVDTTKAYETTDERCVYFKGSAEPGPKTGIGTLVEHATCCACSGDTDCPEDDLPSAVSFSGTWTASGFDGVSGNCTNCINAISGETVWDGVFLQVSGQCRYTIPLPANAGDYQIDGKELEDLFLAWETFFCRWEFTIRCRGSNTPIIWSGIGPNTPADPTGTYTRVNGCDSTPTRTVS